ncbi:MAG: TIGR00730 family Rossman fold protein [Betaproteobacteria bacterium]|nr:TIGR00730 family Rossman fold protein [Betaproteobacteria bacterium]
MTNAKVVKPAGLGQEISAREAWKLFGIMAEFFEATERLAAIHPAVSVFGSARVAPGTPYYELAEETARLLSDAGFAVISGGGPGLMEATNKGAFEGSGIAVGLNIDLPREQSGSRYQNVSLRFKHFFARKVMFVRFASAFVVLPGGYGTLDELFEALTLVQTGKTRQMPILLVHEPYWRGLLQWMKERLAAEGMIDETDLDLVQVCNSAREVVDAIFSFYDKRGFQPSPAEREVLLNL